MRETHPPAVPPPPCKGEMCERLSLPQQNPLKAAFGLAGRLFRRVRETVGSREQRESGTSHAMQGRTEGRAWHRA